MSNGKNLMDVAISFKNKEAVLIKSNESNIFYFENNSVWKQMSQSTLEIKMRKYAEADKSFAPDTRSATLKDVIENLKAITYCDGLVFDQFINRPLTKDTYFINFKNGILCLQVNKKILVSKLIPHSEDFFTIKQLGYDFNKKAGCPKFITFLNSTLGENEIAFLQEWFGYLLIPSTITHKMLVMRGLGQNGKSIILRIIKLLLGNDCVSHVPLSGFAPNARFVLIKTDKKLINIVEELDDRKSIASAVIKRFVAGNTVQVEDKFGDPEDMIPTARVMISTNQELLIDDNSDGLKRRVIILPFTKQVKEEDKNTNYDTDEYWIDELSGIRNWALRGLNRLIANKWKFTESPLMKEALNSFTNIINPQQKFLNDYIEFSPKDKLFGTEMYLKYTEHCFHHGIVPVRDSVFGREIIKVFPFVIKTQNAHTFNKGKIKTRTHIYYGIKFKPDSTPDDLLHAEATAQQTQVY